MLEEIDPSNVDELQPISPLWQPEDVSLSGAGIIINFVDENLALIGNYLPMQLRVLDIERMEFGEIVSFPDAEFLYRSALSASTGYAAVHDERTLYLVNLSSLETEEIQSVERSSGDYVDDLIFSPTVPILAYTVSNTETDGPSDGLHLYDFSQEKEIAFISYPGISSFTIQGDGIHYVLAGVNGDVILWDSVTGDMSTVRPPDGKLVTDVSYLDRTSIVLGVMDDSGSYIELWNIQTYEQIPSERRGRSDFYFGQGIAATQDLTGIQFWLPLSNQSLAQVEDVQVQDISVRTMLLITSSGTDFDFRRLDTGEIMHSLSVPNLPYALMTSDNQRLIFWNSGGFIQIWGIPEQ
jgi:hypothetical protein